MKSVLCCFTVNPDFTQFALPQLKSLLQSAPFSLQILFAKELKVQKYSSSFDITHDLFANFPSIVLSVPDFQKHRKFFQNLCRQSVMIYKVVLLISQGNSYEQMMQGKDEQLLNQYCRNQNDQVACQFFSRNRVIQRQDQVFKIHKVLGAFEVKGKVNFKAPKIKYQLIEEHSWYQQHHKTQITATLKHVYFGIELGCNKIATAKFNSKYQLKNRIYLGPTSTDNDLAFLMCNQALIQKGSIIIDPFVGTAGLLIPPASKGAIVFGSDLDIRVINGYSVGRINKRSSYYNSENKFQLFTPKINLNFEQYGFEIPNIIRIDCMKLVLRQQQFFDAIVTDPPYGIRAMSRSVTAKKQENKQMQQIQKEEECSNQTKQLSNEQDLKKEQKQETLSQIEQKKWKIQKRKRTKQNKKRRNEQLPAEQKKFKQDLVTRLNKERVEHWDKFDKQKIETTERQIIFQGLLTFAKKYLKKRGRLVFLYPIYEDEEYKGISSLPSHHGFQVIDLSQNKMSKGNSRILVTMQKQ